MEFISSEKTFLSVNFIIGIDGLCGVNAVMFYATSILAESGSTITPSLGTILIGLAQWIATFVGAILVDFTGRRSLLITSGTIHVFSMLVFGIYYHFSATEVFGWIPVVSMVVFIIGFSIGWGPVPWLLVAEITPHESKSQTAAMSTCINWTLAFVVTKTFKELQELLTKHGVFYLFSALSAVSVLFAAFLLPETKNKSYEQIRAFF
ncbi:trehalose transporter-like protein, partial [Euroglyphus maynei]